MKFTFLFLCISSFCFGQNQDIVLTSIDYPKQKSLYPQSYWNVWVKDLPRTENSIKNPNASRRIREMEYFNRFLLYAKMQTNTPEELISIFMDSYKYAPHYTVNQYTSVLPLRGKEYRYMWKMYSKEKKTFDSISNKLLSSYDLKLMDRLAIIKEKDQYYRKQIGERTLTELKADGSWQKQLDFDKQNSNEIKTILNRIGYPGRSKVGYKNESIVFLVIQHSNLELMEYGLPLIQNAIKNLDLKASYFAYLYDRIQLVKKLPQRYGTQYNLDGTLYHLSEPKTVNERRQKYGLHAIKI
jgi:hypothetical protein